MDFDIDHGSNAAQSYQRLFQKLLDEARCKNDGIGLSEKETDQLRGRIALLKELLALPAMTKIREAQARIEHPV